MEQEPKPDTVTLAAGTIRGSTRDGIRRFLGIPYAAPPIGARRFAQPTAPDPWDGERDATRPGPCAPHRTKPFPGLDVIPLVGTGGSTGGDYLTLNIWAPGEADAAAVLVFVHGGGFVVGSKDASVHDGSAFARDGVVCVAINYRLGVDGFLPILGAPTNLGLRDMIAALTWVRDNIAAFGGDPGRITVAGESAGGMSVADLVASPLANGLFQRAIVQSGHGSMVREMPVAHRLVRKLAGMLNITPDAAGFALVDTEQVLDAVEKVQQPTARLNLRDDAGYEPVFGISRFVPVIGDDVLPRHPVAALERGAGAAVDLLIGTNAQEMNLYWIPTGVKAKLNRVLAWLVLRRSLPRAWTLLKVYGAGKRPIGDVFADATTDLVFRAPARRYAAAHQGRTWLYEFDWRSPQCGGELGAAHGMELPFVFDTLAVATGPEGLCGEAPPQDLADRIHRLWVAFVNRTAPPWPEFDDRTRQVYQLERGEAVHEPAMPAAAFLP